MSSIDPPGHNSGAPPAHEDEDAAFPPGTVVDGRYRIQSLLGEGGMAFVYKAFDDKLARPVALKIMRLAVAAHVARFEREARATAALTHPAVVRIYAFGRLPDRRPFLVLEFVEGVTLIDHIDLHGAMGPMESIRLMSPVLGALAEAHKAGIVHRDIKADNLILQPVTGAGLILRLLDFSIAAVAAPEGPDGRRLTATGQLFGTPEYMAPEQAIGKRATSAADIWSVGVVLRLMVTDDLPFDGRNTPEILYRLVNEPPKPLPDHVPSAVAAIISRCLVREPEERPDAMALIDLANAAEAPTPSVQGSLSSLDGSLSGSLDGGPAESHDLFDAPDHTDEVVPEPVLDQVGALLEPPTLSKRKGPRLGWLVGGFLGGVALTVAASLSVGTGPFVTPDAAPATVSIHTGASAARGPLEPLAVAEALISINEGKAALAWLKANPGRAGAVDPRRDLIQALAELDANYLRKGLNGIKSVIKTDASMARDPRVVSALVSTLRYKRGEPAVRLLAELLQGPEAVSTERALLKAASTPNRRARWRAVEAFKTAGRDDRAARLAALKADLGVRSCERRRKAVEGLAKLGDASVLADLRTLKARGPEANRCLGNALDHAIEKLAQRR